MSHEHNNKFETLYQIAAEYRTRGRSSAITLLKLIRVISKMDEQETMKFCELIIFGDTTDGEG